MSPPASKASTFASQLLPHAWWLALLVSAALLLISTNRRIDRVTTLTDIPTWSVDAPQRDHSTLTGFENGQRHLIIPGHHSPSYTWITEAQMAADAGFLRLRHIDYDSAPEGRDINRTAPYRIWLIAVGWLYTVFNGESLGYSIERGALIADPLLLGLLLAFGTIYTARTLGGFAAIGFTVGMTCLFPLSANFLPGAPDPRSLSWVLAVGSVLPLIASSRGEARRSRAPFALAGLFGGIGLWNDATSQTLALLGVFLGALVYEAIRWRGSKRSASPPPAYWGTWAMAGSATTLAAVAVEFAPDHLSWSLAAVHPIHAVAWLGFGGALMSAGLLSREGKSAAGRQTFILLAVSVLAIAAWPVTAILSDSGSLLATDFHSRQLANHPAVGLAPNLGEWLNRAEGFGLKWATLSPAILFFALVTRVFMGKASWERRGQLAFALVACLLAIVLASLQVRLWNLVDALTLTLLACYFSFASTSPERSERIWALAAGVIALPGLFVGFPASVKDGAVEELTELEAQGLVERDFSYWLNKRSGDEPIVLFSTPIFSGAAGYYGGFKTIVSSDDDNESGIQAAVRIASANSEQEVSILLNSRGVTHVALPMWDPMLGQLVRIGLNVPPGQQLPPEAFAISLMDWDIPAWMRPLHYYLPNQPEFRGFAINAFARHVEQSPELALSRLADLFVEKGQIAQILRSLRGALEAYPRSIEALAGIANIDRALGDRAKLEETLETLTPYLSRRTARNLPADRRIAIAALLMQTNQPEPAKEQVVAALRTLDVDTLRLMTPNAVALTLALSKSLDIPFPNEELKAYALQLVPPQIREKLARP